MPIKGKILAILAMIMGIAALGGAIVFWQIYGQQPALNALQSQTKRVAEADMPLVIAVAEAKSDALAVQQHLSDLALTKDAAKMAAVKNEVQHFEDHMAKAQALAMAGGKSSVKTALDQVLQAFPPFLASGEAMTQAYLHSDPETGTALMDVFEQTTAGVIDALNGAMIEVSAGGQDTLRSLEVQTQELQSRVDVVIGAVIWLAVAGWGLGVGGAVMIYRLIQNALSGLSQDIEALETHSSKPLSLLKRHDEFRVIGQSLEAFRTDLLRGAALEAEQKAQQERIEHDRRALLERLARELETNVQSVVSQISSASTEMHASAEGMSETARMTSEQAHSVSQAANEAADSVQSVASAAEELAQSIDGISRQVAASADIAAQAVEKASRTHDTIQGLSRAAERIGEVVALITGIAEQTNLLALNATIEAARAGDAGKGFAVVANEVKTLATQTGRATEEISRQIASVQQETVLAVRAIEDISLTIGQVHDLAASVAQAVERQGAATTEISQNVELASHGALRVSETIEGVSSAAKVTGTVAGQVFDAARALSGQARTLAATVERSVADMRAS